MLSQLYAWKEIALVPFSEYLTIVAGNAGAEVNSKITPNPDCNKKEKGKYVNGQSSKAVNGIPSLCFRKTVDDAFTSAPSKVDVGDDGKPKAGGLADVFMFDGWGSGCDVFGQLFKH